MSETASQRAQAVQGLIAATANESDTVKQAALQAVIPPPPRADVGFLWKALVVGLLALTLVSIVGVLWAVLDGKSGTDAKTALLVFTPLVTGLLGLFAPSPAQSP
jgi:hypothetical protein